MLAKFCLRTAWQRRIRQRYAVVDGHYLWYHVVQWRSQLLKKGLTAELYDKILANKSKTCKQPRSEILPFRDFLILIKQEIKLNLEQEIKSTVKINRLPLEQTTGTRLGARLKPRTILVKVTENEKFNETIHRTSYRRRVIVEE